MDPVTTVGAGAIIIPAVIIVGTIVALKVWHAIRPVVGVILVIIAVFQFIGMRATGVLAMGAVGWLAYMNVFGADYWWLSILMWFLGFVQLVTMLMAPRYSKMG